MTDIPAHDIEALVRIFDASSWDELHVVTDGVEIYLSKNPQDRLQATTITAPRTDLARPAIAVPSPAIMAPSDKTIASTVPDGMIVVRAPNLGTFYRSPKPGAPPYVVIGQKVEPDTEVCLIEVMKLFTPVRAGTAGTVRQILAEDSQVVEFDQPLFLIEPLT
jgi:acetyl-CoA carboxylase biotin carboxyl carrier protein